MGNFQKGGNRNGGFKSGGPKPSFHKKSWDGGRDRSVTMHKAVCDECGNSCEVPFRPSQDKPIFCNNCFGSKREGGERRDDRKDFRGSKGKFDTNKGSKFESKPQAPQNNDEIKRHIQDLHAKVDHIVSTLAKLVQAKEEKVAAKIAPLVAKIKEEVKSKKTVKAAIKKSPAKKVVAKKPAAKVVVKKKK